MKKVLMTICFVVIVCFQLLFSGCEITGDPSKDNAILGAGLGALAGQAIGGDTKGTLIGAGIGGVGGYAIGAQQKKQQERQAQADARLNQLEQSANTIQVVIHNSNGSTSIVSLTKDNVGGCYGPRGEHYQTIPTEEQLKQAGYGF
jgi:hypothetical protein